MPITRRDLLLGGAAATLGLAFCGDAMAADPEPPLIAEDYALARARFATDLTRRGPSPDKPQPLGPPRGATRVDYRSGALPLVAWISQNADPAHPRPAVLVLHGGNSLWPGHWDIAKPFVEAGYVAMMPAVRAENGLPGAFSGFYDENADVLAAAEVLRATPGVDPANLFIVGHSVGGTLTMLAAMTAPIFRAAAAFSGNPDARRFFGRFPEDIRFDATNPREFDMRSAACFAGSFKCPILLLHGAKEKGSDAAIRLTVSRAQAAGVNIRRSIVEGDHMGAIPGESAEALKWFAEL